MPQDPISLDAFTRHLGEEITKTLGLTVVASQNKLTVFFDDGVRTFSVEQIYDDLAHGEADLEACTAQVLSGVRASTVPVAWGTAKDQLRLNFIRNDELYPDMITRPASPVLIESMAVDFGTHFDIVNTTVLQELGQPVETLWETALHNTLEKMPDPKRGPGPDAGQELLMWIDAFGAVHAWHSAAELSKQNTYVLCSTPAKSVGVLLINAKFENINAFAEGANTGYKTSVDKLTPVVHIFHNGTLYGTATFIEDANTVVVQL